MDDNAPSPNKSRNKLGNLNAAKNTSDKRPAPKNVRHQQIANKAKNTADAGHNTYAENMFA